jgi:hypothetical protein
MIFWKLICLFFYYLGDLACRIGDGKCYQYLMLKSVEINDKFKLNIWKEIEKPFNED